MANLNLEEILVLFQNGERRYEEDPAFTAVIDSLKMGLGVYAVLDHVLKEQSVLREMVKTQSENIKRLNTELDTHRPEPEFGECHRCRGWDEMTRMGFQLCANCTGS